MAESKSVQITLWNNDGIDLDSGMLDFAFRVAARHAPQANLIDIFPDERIPSDAPEWKYPGRIEWLVRVNYRHGGSLTIGLLQRSPDGEFESHT